MNEHRATETAFKNGYKKAAEDIFAEIELALNLSRCYGDSGIYFEYSLEPDIAELKKKYTEGENND